MINCFKAYLLVFIKAKGCFAVLNCFEVLFAWEFGRDLGDIVVVSVLESQVCYAK